MLYLAYAWSSDVHSCTWPQPYSSKESPIWLWLLLADNWTWTFKWKFRWLLWLNALSHRWHLYGLSPVWILLCTVRCLAVVNRFPQTEHSNGFSPEWNRRCIVNDCLLWHFFPHSLHLNLLLCIFICCFKYFWAEKHFLHSVHEYILSLCVSLCLFSAHSVANSLSQSVRTRGLELLSHAGSVV